MIKKSILNQYCLLPPHRSHPGEERHRDVPADRHRQRNQLQVPVQRPGLHHRRDVHPRPTPSALVRGQQSPRQQRHRTVRLTNGGR